MKRILMCLAAALALLTTAWPASAAETVNLTPAPARLSLASGSLDITRGFTVGLAAGLPADMATEADKFVEALNRATGLEGRVTEGADATFAVALNTSIEPEGYTLKVTPEGATIAASTPRGLFYAFQTIRKVLPANVMAGIRGAADATYSLPAMTVTDKPRYAYRGYMLDVSRHFFDVNEVKRIIDIMSFYKLNVFHFHLTDDQGWRFPVDKYPLLTTVGATRANSLYTDMASSTQFWTNAQYGPYAYTKDELRDIVAYAAERHIEVIPEIEMPGHFSAAIAAYPFLSCTPAGSHSVQTSGGVFNDVLNIGSPAAVAFAKDILEEVMEIFPSEYIHIGGDECPDTRWRNNADCQALAASLGLGDNYRALQSHFTEEMAAWARERGKKLVVWNESLTAGGTDVEAIRRADPVVMCWTGADGAANKAANNGLSYVYTPQVPFYICRKYSDSTIPGPGPGDSDTPKVYDWGTPDNDLCMGIQGTFWGEHVTEPAHLEYMSLPRLMAIAESGWTPKARKSYDSFSARMTADVELLDLLGYSYHRGPKGITMPAGYTDPAAPAVAPLAVGSFYTFANAAPGFEGLRLADNGADRLAVADSRWAADAWQVASASESADGKSRTVTLVNAATGRKIGATLPWESGYGSGVTMSSDAAAPVTLSGIAGSDAVSLAIGGGGIRPLEPTSARNPSTVVAGNPQKEGAAAPIGLGAQWTVAEVVPYTYTCLDEDGNELGVFHQSIPAGEEPDLHPIPAIANYTATEQLKDGERSIVVKYRRSAYTVTYTASVAPSGVKLAPVTVAVEIGKPYTVDPSREFFTLASSEPAAGTVITPTADITVAATYTTDALLGVEALADEVTALADGHSYVIKDDHADRWAYRMASGTEVGGTRTIPAGPEAVWTLAGSGSQMSVMNALTSTYVAPLGRSQTGKLQAQPALFTFDLVDGVWRIHIGDMYWDGLENLNLVGWNAGQGHPYRIYEFVGRPYFTVTTVCEDTDGKELSRSAVNVAAGEPYQLFAPSVPGRYFKEAVGADALGRVAGHTTVRLIYTSDPAAGIDEIAPDAAGAPRGIYDLSGRRLRSAALPGVYIIDGVKTMVR